MPANEYVFHTHWLVEGTVEEVARVLADAEGLKRWWPSVPALGTGTWRMTQESDWVNVEYDWRIRAEKPLLRLLSPILKPLFAFSHRWAMERGEESLRLELARRRAKDDPVALAAIPPPPGATWRR